MYPQKKRGPFGLVFLGKQMMYCMVGDRERMEREEPRAMIEDAVMRKRLWTTAIRCRRWYSREIGTW